MVVFNELRLSDDKQYIIIDCNVQNLSIYSDMYIASVDIEHFKNYSETGSPGEHSYRAYPVSDPVIVSSGSGDIDPPTHLHLRVALADVKTAFGVDSLDGALLYVYVTCDGLLPEDIDDYGEDASRLTDIGIIIDWQKLYKSGVNALIPYVYGCGLKCDIPASLEQFVLFWNAIRLAAETCDFVTLNSLWSKFLGMYSLVPTPCNCN